MEKIYKISFKILSIVFLLNFSVMSSQVTIITVGNYTPGAVSDNGMVSLQTNGGSIYKWDAANGLSQIGSITNGYPAAGRTLISNNGLKIASSVTNSVSGFNEISVYDVTTSTWTHLGGLITTGLDGYISSTWDMSSDGNTVVGLGWLAGAQAHAVKWTSQSGMVDLGSIVPNRSSRANAVNADGTIIVGWQDEADGSRRGAKWVNGVESFITDSGGNLVGEAGAVSADGNTIVGTAVPEPYVWNSSTGLTYITHPSSGMYFRGGATGVSADGNTVIGFFRNFPGPAATGEGFIWSLAGGRINLNTYASGLGINTQGVTMSLPLAISPDGKKIAGIGLNASNQAVAFLLDITAYLSVSENAKQNNNLSIYPNPVKDILYIKGSSKIQKTEIYNMVGQKVASFDSVGNQIDVSSLSKGNYILKYSVDMGNHQSLKFIKQ